MECNDELKEIDIKICTSFFNDIIKTEEFENILRDENLYKNILSYEILYKSLTTEKSLCIRFDKVDQFTRVYNGARY